MSGEYVRVAILPVRWDGRDFDANLVEDGLYLVVVEAVGEKQVKTLVIVR